MSRESMESRSAMGGMSLFKRRVKYDGDVGREQHDYPTTEELPA
jgi:hypothetical protein